MYNSNIVNYTVNGATNYASEATRENEILDQTASIIESAVDRISDIAGGNTGENPGGDEGEEPETPPEEIEPPVVGIDFGNLTEEQKDELVGQYVDYTPISGSFTSEGQYNGYGNQQFSTITGLKWKILNASDNTLTLISEAAANTSFTLQGANGYNNGVKLLNDACAAMYSNSSLGATGRSLNIDDIETYMTYNKNSYSNYGNEYTTSFSYRYYPNIFALELTGSVNGTYGSRYGLSEQEEYVTGYTQASTLRGMWTYYTFTMSTSTMQNQTYANLFSSSTTAWLASRCVICNSADADFHMFYVSGSTVDVPDDPLYHSGNNGSSHSYAVRPVVEIDLSKVYVGETGSGADGDAYSIVAR